MVSVMVKIRFRVRVSVWASVSFTNIAGHF